MQGAFQFELSLYQRDVVRWRQSEGGYYITTCQQWSLLQQWWTQNLSSISVHTRGRLQFIHLFYSFNSVIHFLSGQ